MIKCVMLDYGGVYAFSFDFTDWARTHAELFGIDPVEISSPKIIEAFVKFCCGQHSSQSFVDQIIEALPNAKRISVDHFEEATIGLIPLPDPAMKKLVAELRGRGIKVGLVSDITPGERARLDSLGAYDGFDFKVLSCDVAASKLEPAIFKAATTKSGFAPGETLFVDDSQYAIDSAKALGLQTLFADHKRYKTAARLAKDILLAANI